MFQWLQDHNQALNTVANLGMLLVWVAYLQLFLQNFRRQRRAHILINRGAGRDLNARCLIGNMSSEAIYIESIIAKLHDGQEVIGCAITDFVRQDGGAQSDDRRFDTLQGPLSAGDYIDVGSFRSMFDQVARSVERELEVPDRSFGIEVLIIVDYASENLVVGAKRRFEVESQRDRVLLNPCSAGTEQIRSRRERRQLEAMKQEYL